MNRVLAGVLLIAGAITSGTFGDDAHDPEAVTAKVNHFLKIHKAAILRELSDLLAIPNVASDRANILRNVALLEQLLGRRGFSTQRLEIDGSPPALFGELPAPGATRTIVMYMHYDGQPVDPAAWATDPWRPILRNGDLSQSGVEIPWPGDGGDVDGEWRIYARSAGDDKAPIAALLAAIDALQNEAIARTVNLKLFLEGEEEAGSPHLAQLLHKYAGRLDADLWLMCDGPVHQSRQMQVFYGARGVVGLEMTVYGPLKALHSGHYGNWAPNPIVMLSHLIAALRDQDGQILIPGFYDDVRDPTEAERRALETVPDRQVELREELALGRNEGGGRSLEELIMRPALNLQGVQAGGVGEKARNAIPTEATAAIDFRLVPDQTPEKVRDRVEAHFRARGYHIVRETPSAALRKKHPRVVKLEWGHGYPPARTPLDSPASRAVVQVLAEARGDSIVEMPTLGGSLPLYLFEKELGTHFIGVPIVNHDNNQHAANENLRLQNLWDGVVLYAGLLARLGPVWDGSNGGAGERGH